MMFAKMEIYYDNVVHKVRKQLLFLTMDDCYILYYTESDVWIINQCISVHLLIGLGVLCNLWPAFDHHVSKILAA